MKAKPTCSGRLAALFHSLRHAAVDRMAERWRMHVTHRRLNRRVVERPRLSEEESARRRLDDLMLRYRVTPPPPNGPTLPPPP